MIVSLIFAAITGSTFPLLPGPTEVARVEMRERDLSIIDCAHEIARVKRDGTVIVKDIQDAKEAIRLLAALARRRQITWPDCKNTTGIGGVFEQRPMQKRAKP